MRRAIKYYLWVLIIGCIISFILGYFSGRNEQKIVNIVRQVVVATAYNSLPEQTDSTPNITASGTSCRPGVIACNFLPIGTKVWIKGFGKQAFVVEDRMHKRFSKRVDIWMAHKHDAIKFGKRQIVIAYCMR